MTQPQPTTPHTVHSFSLTPVPAPIVLRIAAFVLDFGGTIAITAAIVWACVLIGFDGYDGTGGGNEFVVYVGIFAIFAVPLASVILNVRLAHTRLYSIGMLLTRIRIVDATTHGPVGTARLIGRVAILIVPGFIMASAVAGIFTALTSVAAGRGYASGPSVGLIVAVVLAIVMLVPMLRGDRRGWQDKATRTRVNTAASTRAAA